MQPMVQMRDVWTVADLQALDVEDWRRYEIVDGSLVVSPSTGGDHELVAEEIRASLRTALSEDLVVVGPMGVAVGRSYFIPDLVVAARADVRRTAVLPPSSVVIAVEVVSPGSKTMDRVVKPAHFAAAGIAHYWRVETDPLSLTVYALSPGAATYTEAGTWFAGDTARIVEPFAVEIQIDALLD